MLANVQHADVYTDFNGLAKLRTEAKQKTPEAIKEVAEQFESIFVGMMLKSMRAAKLTEGGLMDNDQSKMFQDMYDQQLSLELSGDSGIGLADVIAKQLSPKVHQPSDILNLESYQSRPVRMKDSIIHSFDNERITSKQEFVQKLQFSAKKAAKELGVDAQVLLAQAALETGWGKNINQLDGGKSSFNLFNIKANSGWKGKQAVVNTLEFNHGVARQEKAKFRAYDNYEASFADYVQFIKQTPRYHKALEQGHDAAQYMHELQAAGYATDPKYADKVMRVYQDKALSMDKNSVASISNNGEL